MPSESRPTTGSGSGSAGRFGERLSQLGQLLGFDQVRSAQRDDFGLVGKAGAISVELVADDALRCRPDRRRWHRPGGAAPGMRSTWPRKRSPMPAPSAAPSISPGMSASTNSRPLWRTTPSCGRSVVNGIVADLGLGVGDGVDEGRLAGIGQADQADVGQQLQPQPDPHFLARPAGAVLARRAVGRGLVAGIAAAAVAALEEDDALADLGEVGEQRPLLVVGQDLGADRDLDDQVLAAGAGPVGARRRPCRAAPGNAGCSESRSAY